MPVDRERRDTVADALAAYLNGEIDHRGLKEAYLLLIPEQAPNTVVNTKQDAFLDPWLETWFHHDDMYKADTEAKWRSLCHVLTFLKTDIEQRPWPDRVPQDDTYENRLARWHMAALLLMLGISYLSSWWLLLVASLISFVLFNFSASRHHRAANLEQAKREKIRREYSPFADEKDWLAHQHLLEPYLLKPYIVERYAELPSVRKWPAILEVPVRWMGYFCIAIAGSWIVLFSLLAWPVWLLLLSLQQPSRPAESQGS